MWTRGTQCIVTLFICYGATAPIIHHVAQGSDIQLLRFYFLAAWLYMLAKNFHVMSRER